MSKPTTITATYRIVTPMFCAGANQQKAELRLASFKGALRFWWRTLMAGTYGGNIQKLHAAEASLFGSSEREFGQSKVRMRMRWLTDPPKNADFVHGWPPNQPAVGSTYLGYGITQSGREGTTNYKPHRVGLPENLKFEVRCSVQHEDPVSIARGLKALGLFGGLGSRSRRGFGSIAVEQLNTDSFQMNNGEDFRKSAGSWAGMSTDDLPAFSAFSSHSRLYVGPVANSARAAHAALGEAYRGFRGQPSKSLSGATTRLSTVLRIRPTARRSKSPLSMHRSFITFAISSRDCWATHWSRQAASVGFTEFRRPAMMNRIYCWRWPMPNTVAVCRVTAANGAWKIRETL